MAATAMRPCIHAGRTAVSASATLSQRFGSGSSAGAGGSFAPPSPSWLPRRHSRHSAAADCGIHNASSPPSCSSWRRTHSTFLPERARTSVSLTDFHTARRPLVISAITASAQKLFFSVEATAKAADSLPLPIATSDLVTLVTSGPIASKAGLTQDDVEKDSATWLLLGGHLAAQLEFDAANLSDAQLRRIFHYYLPVFFWCTGQLRRHREQWESGTDFRPDDGAPPPLVIGISAPQGCGKTTVVESLEHLFAVTGLKAASVSIDDFYLRRQDQAALASSSPDNQLLELRGNAGSHDLDLAASTLSALKAAQSEDSSVPLPRYDKSAFSGLGDRAAEEVWPVAKGPLDVVLLEGWMLGFEPIDEADAFSVDQQLLEVNRNLALYGPLHDAVDAWIVVHVDDVQWVYQWRLEAEVRMRAAGKPGMSDEQVADFVSRYMPAYKAYLPTLYGRGPRNSHAHNTLVINVDAKRNCIG